MGTIGCHYPVANVRNDFCVVSKESEFVASGGGAFSKTNRRLSSGRPTIKFEAGVKLVKSLDKKPRDGDGGRSFGKSSPKVPCWFITWSTWRGTHWIRQREDPPNQAREQLLAAVYTPRGLQTCPIWCRACCPLVLSSIQKE